MAIGKWVLGGAMAMALAKSTHMSTPLTDYDFSSLVSALIARLYFSGIPIDIYIS